jgi:uncharacterized protein YndB with AHSA1/START domain
MLKIMAIIGAVIMVAIVVVLIMAALKPNVFRVQRATLIKAPPEKIFPLINDYRNWASWSPYEKKDPAMKRTFSGAASGKGAVYEWDGDKNVGHGRMEILDAPPPSKVTLKLDFMRPFEAHNIVDFVIEPRSEGASVTWDMRGPVPFMGKVMHVFINMDRMVGTDFEIGLANLKAIAER